jgi:hypothetical protein
MKSLPLSAVALALAAPAAAQTPLAAPAHQGHAQQSASQSDAHAGHTQHQNHAGGNADHSKPMSCCADANGNGKMDCCEGAQATTGSCCDKHAGSVQSQPAKPAQPK